MFRKLCLISICSAIACFAIGATTIPASAQTTLSFQYVIPRFSSNAGSELIISNLSGALASLEVTFSDSALAQGASAFITIGPGTQQRLSAASFALSSFQGSVVVNSSIPLSVIAKIAAVGGFETVAPAAISDYLIVPFSQGTTGDMRVTIFNSDSTQASAVILPVALNGSVLGEVQITVPALGTVTEDIAALFPQPGFGSSHDISHVVIRIPTSVFSPKHSVFVQAEMLNFSDPAEGILIPRADFSVVTAVPASAEILNGTIPFFIQGGDYVTELQFISTSNTAGTVTLTALGFDGNTVPGTAATTITVPANGAVRRSVQDIFGLGTGITTGSIVFQSTTPVVSAEAIASVSQNGFVVIPAGPAPATNFAFSIRDFDPQFFVGLTFLNPSGSMAHLTVRYLSDAGVAISTANLTLDPSKETARVLSDLMPEVRTAGFIHVSSDVPIIMTALENAVDNSSFGALPAMHSSPDYTPPNPVRFLISGTVRQNGVPFPGVKVQLSGPVNVAATTDQNGMFVFQSSPQGNYTLTPLAVGYAFSPASSNVSITNDNVRNNDFAATLQIPTITAIQPAAVVAGSPSTTVFVAGSPLTPTSQIVFDGNPLPTTLTTAGFSVNVVSATGAVSVVIQTLPALQATIDSSALAVPHVASLFIRTTGPGGSVSSAASTFVIGGPAPVLSSLGAVPVPLIAGNLGFTTTITGSGFLPGVSVLVNGVPRPTTLLTPTTVQVIIPPDDLAIGSIVKVSAINKAPTVGPSNSLDLPVLNPVPVVLSISPDHAPVELEPNMPALSVTVSGFGFKPGAQVKFNGALVPTTPSGPSNFQSATSLVGAIPQSLLLVGGAYSVAVVNPEPSVGPSNGLPLLLSNLLPVLTAAETDHQLTFDPSRPLETYPAQIVVRGSNFSPASIFEFLNTCVVPGLSVAPSSATVVTGTTQQFTAYNNGVATAGVSWAVNSIVGGNLVVGLISASGLYTAPPAVPSPPAVLITATGGGTFATAIVTVAANVSSSGGVTGPGVIGATLISSHEANVTITVQCVGTYSVDVRNPQPGGGTSQKGSINVIAPAPIVGLQITSLSPSSITRGSPSFTLTISGSGFVAGAVVNFGSAVLIPTSISSASITAIVPSYLITVSDLIPVVVTSPDNGGSSNRGSSAPLLFTVTDP